jgi:hypothetical protein
LPTALDHEADRSELCERSRCEGLQHANPHRGDHAGIAEGLAGFYRAGRRRTAPLRSASGVVRSPAVGFPTIRGYTPPVTWCGPSAGSRRGCLVSQCSFGFCCNCAGLDHRSAARHRSAVHPVAGHRFALHPVARHRSARAGGAFLAAGGSRHGQVLATGAACDRSDHGRNPATASRCRPGGKLPVSLLPSTQAVFYGIWELDRSEWDDAFAAVTWLRPRRPLR